jgi:hypothetical protein
MRVLRTLRVKHGAPSPFRRLHSRSLSWETWIFRFLHALGYCCVLVTVTWIVDSCFYGKDYCDGVVIWVCVYLHCDTFLLLWMSTCFLLILILVVLPDACVLLVPLGLAA